MRLASCAALISKDIDIRRYFTWVASRVVTVNVGQEIRPLGIDNRVKTTCMLIKPVPCAFDVHFTFDFSKLTVHTIEHPDLAVSPVC